MSAAAPVPHRESKSQKTTAGGTATKRTSNGAKKSKVNKVILLTFFDGIGTAELCLKELGFDILGTIRWETEEECQLLTAHHYPQGRQRGDFTKDDAKKLMAVIKELDPEGTARLFITAGPPCPDFSRIRGDNGPGRAGAEGAKFDHFCDFVETLESLANRPVIPLVENVVMQKPEDAKHFCERLKSTMVLCDASDFGLIGRPRLWWTRIDWKAVDEAIAPDNEDCPLRRWLHQYQITWKVQQGYDRMIIETEPDVPSNIETYDCLFSDAVRNRRTRMPCLTTPAPTDNGRPAPTRRRGDNGPSRQAQELWSKGQRQYAPWHYEPDVMMIRPDGSLQIPTANIKERMHHLPTGYTEATGADDKTRHRMLGNGWHAGVAKVLICLALLFTPTTAISTQMHPGGARPIDRAAYRWRMKDVPYGPRHWDRHLRTKVEATDDPEAHFHAARSPVCPRASLECIDPATAYALQLTFEMRQEIRQWRSEILEDLHLLIEELSEETNIWFEKRPSHIQKAYSLTPTPQSSTFVTQIPVLIHLLERFDYPDHARLANELSNGFPMLGELTPGVGWKDTTKTYTDRITIPEFYTMNDEYIVQYMQSRRADPHSDILLQEILQEHKTGRIDGPFRGRAHWPMQPRSVVPGDSTCAMPLLTLPPDEISVATAFVIEQTGSDGQPKRRRGEDWRRGLQNRTCLVSDAPHHHTIDHYIDVAAAVTAMADATDIPEDMCTPVAWGHDHEGAYRQLPVRDPNEAFVLLLTAWGPTLWRHNVLLFGAIASVWAYNRFGDVLVFLARALLASAAVHYVDDYGGVEPSFSAPSAFEAFADLNNSLGLRMKPSKAQPPVTLAAQRIQGVELHFSASTATVQTLPQRRDKITRIIDTALLDNCLTIPDAACLAGKCSHVCCAIYGRVGRAAVKPVFARQHGEPNHKNLLNNALRSSLTTLRHILIGAAPRKRSLRPTSRRLPLVYADAYFRMGDLRLRPRDEDIPHNWDPKFASDYENGWGAVVFPNRSEDCTLAFTVAGEVPPQIVKLFCSRKAYIYFLESWAQIVTSFAFYELLSDEYLSFVDNEASKYALLKGYGSDIAINNLIGCFWSHTCDIQSDPWFERVSSKANLSDAISRKDFQEAAAKGWIHIPLKFDETYDILARMAVDMKYAHEVAPSELRRCLGCQVRPFLQQLRLIPGPR